MGYSLFNAINISSSGLSVQRTKMNLISENIANAETTRTQDGDAFRRRIPVVAQGVPGKKFSEIFVEKKTELETRNPNHLTGGKFLSTNQHSLKGVHISEVLEDPSPFRMIYDPYHPDANPQGYVAMPNVNIIQEMTSLINASRSFEANITALNSSKDMIRKALRI